jgi:hypothetical protein
MRSQGEPQAGGRGVSINLVYLATNTRLYSARMTSPQQRQRSFSSQCPEMAA